MSQKKAKKQSSHSEKHPAKHEKNHPSERESHTDASTQGKKGNGVRHHSPGYVVGSIALALVGSAFLAANIAASQFIHPLYEGLINNDTKAWITFFKLSKNKPEFESYLKEVQGTYRQLKPQMEGEQVTKQETIKKLEAYLTANPNAPEVLYALSILYRETDELQKADEYLRQAREIDPDIGK